MAQTVMYFGKEKKMRRYFNTEGKCRPEIHYMVRLDERLERIKRQYVDRGKYFAINRGRQYGKTTTLMALAEYLKDDYIVMAMDFQMMSSANFADEQTFVIAFIEYIERLPAFKGESAEFIAEEAFHNLLLLKNGERVSMDRMFSGLSRICATAKKPIVMIIDEVDSASNNQVFIDFLAQLRGYYLNRENNPTFQSVILAGVYDIKNLKLKLRPDEEHQYNSPWNTREGNEPSESLLSFGDCPRNQMVLVPFDVAARFSVDMSFSTEQIAHMLQEYEDDEQTGMDVWEVSQYIYEYTSGYPYLVSAICKFLDEEIPYSERFENSPPALVWTREGIEEAVKVLLNEGIPLFGSMTKQLDTYKDMRDIIEQILYRGKQIAYSPAQKSINLGLMFGFLKEENGHVAVANRIFEMYLMSFFMAEESLKSEVFRRGEYDKNQFIQNSKLNMDLVLEKFVEYFSDIYGDNDERFIEAYGRKFFLLYLKPIINGTGNYYLEAQTRDAGRTDVVVDYLGEQFVVEMKIWRGNEYNERGRQQLIEYLDYFRLEKGYMLSFNFNKKKKTGVSMITLGDRTIVEAVV